LISTAESFSGTKHKLEETEIYRSQYAESEKCKNETMNVCVCRYVKKEHPKGPVRKSLRLQKIDPAGNPVPVVVEPEPVNEHVSRQTYSVCVMGVN
jgi:hypothetical protein